MNKLKIEKLSLIIRNQSREIRRLEEEYDFLLFDVAKRIEMDLASLLSKILNDKKAEGVFGKKFVKNSKNELKKSLNEEVMDEKLWVESFDKMTAELTKLNKIQISNYEKLKVLYSEPNEGEYSSQLFELGDFLDEIDSAIEIHNQIIQVYTLNKTKSKRMFPNKKKKSP